MGGSTSFGVVAYATTSATEKTANVDPIEKQDVFRGHRSCDHLPVIRLRVEVFVACTATARCHATDETREVNSGTVSSSKKRCDELGRRRERREPRRGRGNTQAPE